jgi:hypothetical protein
LKEIENDALSFESDHSNNDELDYIKRKQNLKRIEKLKTDSIKE